MISHDKNDKSDLTIKFLNPLNAELNPACHLQALLGAHHIFHVSRVKVNQQCPSIMGPH
jgi:hypothetical protein